MKTIYKYKLEIGADTKVSLPPESTILTVAQQNGEVFLWALIEKDAAATNTITYRVVGTGWDIEKPERMFYRGTAHGSPFVWHVFEVI